MEDEPGIEQPEVELDSEDLFTRATDLFKPALAALLLDLIEIGDDLTIDKR